MQRKNSKAILSAAALIVLIALTLAGNASAAEYKVLYKFRAHNKEGRHPAAGLTLDAAGNLYGTTARSGISKFAGTVFKLAHNPDGSWTESMLYRFSGGADGFRPRAGLIFDMGGNLYGTTLWGGPNRAGTVFKMTPNPDGTWTESVLYTLMGGSDGSNPSSLIFDEAGNLYGTTQYGGTGSAGTVFKLMPNPDGSWMESLLYSFTGGQDGGWPAGGVIYDTAGNLYGTTYYGGAQNAGTVFKLSPNSDGSWSQTNLYVFKGQWRYGPAAGLILDEAGNLYGTTYSGGAQSFGSVFKLSPNPDGTWKETTLHAFKGPDGAFPAAALTRDASGNLYGTTKYGGDPSCGCGTVFKLVNNPDGSWKRSTLHLFKRSDGTRPTAGLIFDASGNLYGTTSRGGRDYGVVFEITP